MNAASEIMFLTLLIIFIAKGTSGTGGEYFHMKILRRLDIVGGISAFLLGRKLCELMLSALYTGLLRGKSLLSREGSSSHRDTINVERFCYQSIDNR